MSGAVIPPLAGHQYTTGKFRRSFRCPRHPAAYAQKETGHRIAEARIPC